MEKEHYTGYNSKLKDFSRDLRKNMTPQERRLWFCYLKTYPVKFYRQRSIAYYIADFYCSKAHLVIEIDGGQHYTPEGMDYDRNRTEVIETYQLEVIRFSNSDIDKNFRGVCEYIDLKVAERLAGDSISRGNLLLFLKLFCMQALIYQVKLWDFLNKFRIQYAVNTQ